jgi:HlyD family secretion protein
MEASFTVDAFPGRRFKGVVGQIRNAPQTVQNVVTYDAVIVVDNDDLKLRPGMTATVTIVWAQKDDVLAVPNTALRFRLPPELAPPATAGGSATASAPAMSAMTNVPAPAGAPSGRPARGSGGGGNHRGEGSDARTVFVLRAGAPVAVPVQTGLSDGTITEVVKGDLAAGDAVVTDVNIAGKTGGAPGGAGGPSRIGRMF